MMISPSFFTNILRDPLSPTSLCKITAIALATASLLHATGVMENTLGQTLCPHIKRHVTNLLQSAKEGSTAARVILAAAAIMTVVQVAMLAAKVTFISAVLTCSAIVIAAGYGAMYSGVI